jgi:gluconokinase
LSDDQSATAAIGSIRSARTDVATLAQVSGVLWVPGPDGQTRWRQARHIFDRCNISCAVILSAALMSGPDTLGLPVTVVLMGVTGSGKSTVMARLAEHVGWRRAEADDFHTPANVAKMSAGRALTDDDRWPWLRAIANWIGERESAGENAVVTCSALRRKYRDFLRTGHPSVHFVHLAVDRKILERRMEQRRGHYMPASLLGSQLDTFEPLDPDEPGTLVSGELPPDRIVEEIVTRFHL